MNEHEESSGRKDMFTWRRKLAVSLAAASLALGTGAGIWVTPRVHAQGAVTPKTQMPSEARALSRAFQAVSKAMSPSVVRIDVESEQPRVARQERRQVPPELERLFEQFFGDQFDMPAPGPGRGTGSGLVIDGAGHIITNSHVVDNAAKLTVTFSDGREFSAKVVGRDPNTDVAVVKLEKPPANLVAARLGDSNKVEVGEWVLAVGSPLGLDQSVTAGIVSSKGRVGRHVQMSGARMRQYIQTDAKINPGNSGGPLVNLEGEVIGINTMINMGPGGAYGFAIPINQASQVARTLVSSGRMRHAYLGIYLGDVKDGVRLDGDGQPDKSQPIAKTPARAAWVTRVQPNSPAQKAGVHVGDVITQIDGQKIEAANDVIDYVSSRTVGNKVQLAYQRDGKAGNAQVTLGELDTDVARADRGSEQPQQDKIGLGMQTLTPEVARLLGIDAATKGAVITEVTPGSRAAKAGLRAEDVIVEVDRKPIASSDEAVAALKENPKGGHLLRVRRGGAARFVTIPPQ
jgi:serine protease Do